jgi:hypothetical protein
VAHTAALHQRKKGGDWHMKTDSQRSVPITLLVIAVLLLIARIATSF